jgi:CMP-N-acetylneuraminic acid synthetase
LTYPQRKFENILKAIDYFFEEDFKAMLCKKEVKTHPWLCIHEDGEKVVDHCLWRRQDYPVVYELSHFIAILYAGELKNVDNNLYNKNNGFYLIGDTIDVDHERDFDRI